MLKIKKEIVDYLGVYAGEKMPNEACGYLAGQRELITKFYPMTNVDNSPEHFSFDPEEQFKVMKEARRKRLELLAVYHSHPSSPARMSEEDKRLAYDTSIIYVIYSVRDSEIKSFRIGDADELQEVYVESVS